MIARAEQAPRPNPVRIVFVEDVERAGDLRLTDCAHYDDCLDVALAAAWPGFACHRCEAFALAPSAIRGQP